MSKYENENLTEAANQIETSTIFEVFPLCRRYFPSDGTMLDTLLDLNFRHDEKTLTWKALADAWRKAVPENKQTPEEKTLQKIFDDRAKKESIAKNILFEDGTAPLRSRQTMKLYYLLENKKFPNLLAYTCENTTPLTESVFSRKARNFASLRNFRASMERTG